MITSCKMEATLLMLKEKQLQIFQHKVQTDIYDKNCVQKFFLQKQLQPIKSWVKLQNKAIACTQF